MTTDEPIVIGGSQLQALILGATAAVVGVVWRESILGWPLVLVTILGFAGVAVAYRRCVLDDRAVAYRRLGRTVVAPVGAFDARLGHRYLVVRSDAGDRFRIEVPVEIRPEVRIWVESTVRTSDSGSD
jgi:hypothetical protein